jgi:hypothetical protein
MRLLFAGVLVLLALLLAAFLLLVRPALAGMERQALGDVTHVRHHERQPSGLGAGPGA